MRFIGRKKLEKKKKVEKKEVRVRGTRHETHEGDVAKQKRLTWGRKSRVLDQVKMKWDWSRSVGLGRGSRVKG